MSMLRWARVLAASRSCCSRASAGAAHTALGCSAPQEMTRFRVRLPNTARAVRSRKAPGHSRYRFFLDGGSGRL